MTEATVQPGASGPGDLGRRIRARRLALGWSVGELAAAAGMAPGYLEFLEQRASAAPTAATLARLAGAMETTVTALRGGQDGRPGAGGSALGRPVLEVLDAASCRALLAEGGVGRVVYDGARGPVAIPVNFLLDGDAVGLRTSEGPLAEAARRAGRLSFEVDHLDDVRGEGWSILVTGRAHAATTDPSAPVARPGSTAPEPWAGGDRPIVVWIGLDEVTGRRIRHGA